MAEPTITVVIATISRPTLARTLNSLVGQGWITGDGVLVVGDGPQPVAQELCSLFSPRLPILYSQNPTRTGMWGHYARNWVLDQRHCTTDYLMALDDDDVYLPGAIETARRAFAECLQPRPHVFRMQNHPHVGTVWKEPQLVMGNLGTPVIAVPNNPSRLGRYTFHYGGDFDFCKSTCDYYADGPVWREEVICDVRPYRA
ncbi:glycosyltransferase [Gemmata algarum]|uniref:glycosyltransferase n=1 Tax=Gemmata algarum TaxID=2975278 RepID=UPI0038B32A85